jgi:2-C-methyl-D-erythritol 4-phosphate cytidylyltransferase
MPNTNKQNYSVVIPAAGTGTRFGADVPKQYVGINGRPVLQHTIEFFLSLPFVGKIFVALNHNDTHWLSLPFIEDGRVVALEGGETRAHSVLNALTKISTIEPAEHWVLVHDACRPYISLDEVQRLVNLAIKSDVGGLLAIPSTDTLKRVQDGLVMETVSRETIWRAQTPQMFRLGMLRDALTKALVANFAVTDEASAIEYVGLQPIVVEGSVNNKKITFSEDVYENAID